MAGQPGKLQQSLKHLATSQAPTSSATPVVAHPAARAVAAAPTDPLTGERFRTGDPILTGEHFSTPFPQGVGARVYAAHLARSITSPVLRYSQRLDLLREGHRIGMSRFEANLLIAATLQRFIAGSVTEKETPGRLVVPLTAFFLVQSAVGLGAWWVFAH